MDMSMRYTDSVIMLCADFTADRTWSQAGPCRTEPPV